MSATGRSECCSLVRVPVGGSTVESRWVLGRIFSAGFEERLEDGVQTLEVVVHDVDQERRFHEVADELPRR